METLLQGFGYILKYNNMQVNDYNRESRKFGDNENLNGQQFYVLSLSTQVSEETLILFQQSIRARFVELAKSPGKNRDYKPVYPRYAGL